MYSRRYWCTRMSCTNCMEGTHVHMILESNSFEMWRNPNSRLMELCEEVLPVSPYRVIYILKASVSIDEFVDRCLKSNGGKGQLRGAVMKPWTRRAI